MVAGSGELMDVFRDKRTSEGDWGMIDAKLTGRSTLLRMSCIIAGTMTLKLEKKDFTLATTPTTLVSWPCKRTVLAKVWQETQ